MFPIKDKNDLLCFFYEEVMNTTEVKEYLSVSRQSLNQAIQTGKLQPLPINTDRISLFLRSDVEEYKKNMKRKK